MSNLVWRRIDGFTDGEFAFSGSVHIGMIGTRAADRSRWWWKIDGVDMGRLGHKSGECSSHSAAKKAIVRAWKRWKEAAEL